MNIVKLLIVLLLLTYSEFMYAACSYTGTLNAVGIKIGGGGSNSQINNTTEALAIHASWLAENSPSSGLINNGNYNVTVSGSSAVDRIDFGGSVHDFGGSLPYPGASAGVNGSDFLVHASGIVSLPAGDYTIFVESDDGFSFVMNTLSGDAVVFNKFGGSTAGGVNELRFESPTGNSNTGGSFTLTQDSVFDVAAIFFERGGGDYLEISIANNIRANAAPSGYEILREGALNGKVIFGGCVAPEPIVNYRFDECSYTGVVNDVLDQTGYFNGDSNGLQSPIDEAIINRSLDLREDNTTDWVDVPSTVLDGLNDFSVSVWFKTIIDKSQQEILHALGNSTSDDQLEISLKQQDNVYVKVNDISHDLQSNIKLTDNNWHHLVVTRRGNDVCLFIDGTQRDCDTYNNDPLFIPNDPAVVIGQEQDSFGGGFSTSQNFEGQLDEFKVYDVFLSASDIEDIYQNELVGNNYDGSLRNAVQCDYGCSTLNAVGIKINSSGSNVNINNTTEALNIHAAWLAAGSPETGQINGGTYNVSVSGSSTVDRIDFGGSVNDFVGTLPYPGASDGVNGSDFLVHTSGKISLPAGDYTIFVESDDGFSFVMNRLSGDAVVFSKFGSSTAGGVNELRFENPTGNSNTGGSFTLLQDSVFDVAAIFFERDGGDYIEVSIANNLRTNAAPSGYEILRDGALNGKVLFGDCAAVEHYQILHDGAGLTCAPESVLIRACSDINCTAFDNTVNTNVTLKVNGGADQSIDIINGSSINETITYTNLSTPAVLSLTSDYLCSNTTDNSDGCALEFADAGFIFSQSTGVNDDFDNQIAGAPFTVYLRAVENIDGVCTGLFNDDVTVSLSQKNILPTGNAGLNFTVKDTDSNTQILGKHTDFTTVELNFDGSSEATLTDATYFDAGQIQLHASYSFNGINLVGSSNPFWVSPAKLVISVKAGTTALDGATSTDTPIHKAGVPFDFTVTAYNAIGQSPANITTNYIPQEIQFLLTRTGPTGGGADGSFNYGSGSLFSNLVPGYQSVALNTFNAGVSSASNAFYSEVGLLNLDIQDINYGFTGNVITADAINIGRFIPEHFEQTVVEPGSLDAVCNQNTPVPYPTPFAYLGQTLVSDASKGAISYLVNPVVELTAKNSLGETTKNYTEPDYMKLVAAANFIVKPTTDSTITGKDTNLLPLTANLFAGTVSHQNLVALSPNFGLSLADGVLHYELADGDNFVYPRNENSEINAQDNNIDFLIDQAHFIDGDMVGIVAPANITGTTGINLRFGRAYLENSFGPETTNLPQPFALQYLNASGKYVLNGQDNCTAFDTSNISLTSGTLNANLTGVNTVTGLLNNGETRAMLLTAPGVGTPTTPHQGTVNVEYDIYSWLKYDWDWDGVSTKVFDENPSAIATFGLFRGNDRIIYQREIHQ